MQVTSPDNPHLFRPFAVSISFETANEAEQFYALFDHAAFQLSMSELDESAIRNEIAKHYPEIPSSSKAAYEYLTSDIKRYCGK